MPKVTTHVTIEWDDDTSRALNLASCIVHAPTAELGGDVVSRLIQLALNSFESDAEFFDWLQTVAVELAAEYAENAREVLVASGISNEELTAALQELRGNDG